jgi:hypothetical protein
VETSNSRVGVINHLIPRARNRTGIKGCRFRKSSSGGRCPSFQARIGIKAYIGERLGTHTHRTGTFTLLAYTDTDGDVQVPSTWGDADPHLIDRGKVEQVRLRSFSTNVHSLEVCFLAIVHCSVSGSAAFEK